jgi:hypothetical protein
MFTVGIRRPRYIVIMTDSATQDEVRHKKNKKVCKSTVIKDLDTHVQKVLPA